MTIINDDELRNVVGGAGSSSTTHTVKKGETLGGIAKKYGISLQKLMKDNGISDPNAVLPGTVLKINK